MVHADEEGLRDPLNGEVRERCSSEVGGTHVVGPSGRTVAAAWLVLACQCCLSAVNGFQWANFQPVLDEVDAVFGVSHAEVNTMSLMYVLAWAPAIPFSVMAQSTVGPYAGLVIGAVLNVLATGLKIVSLQWFRSFGMLLVAHTTAGVAEVFFLPLPALIASTWFAPAHRTVATAIASMANSVGISIGYAVIPSVVKCADKHCVDGFWHVFVGQAAFSALLVGLALALPVRPKQPPAITASIPVTPAVVLAGLKMLVKNRNYILYGIASAITLANCWTVSAVMTQFMKTYGVSESNAGLMGSLFSILGAASQLASGVVCDRLHQHRTVLLSLTSASTATFAVMAVLLVMEVDATAVGFACMSLFGVFFVGTLPPMYEFLAETAFPVPVPVAICVQMVLSRIVISPIVTPLASALLTDHPSQTNATHYFFVTLAVMAVANTLLVFVKPEYKRQKADGVMQSSAVHV